MTTSFQNFSAECKEFVPRTVQYAPISTPTNTCGPMPQPPYTNGAYQFEGFSDYRSKMQQQQPVRLNYSKQQENYCYTPINYKQSFYPTAPEFRPYQQ